MRTGIFLAGALVLLAWEARAQQPPEPAAEPPEIPIGYDAFTQWEKWPYLRIGVRAYMKSTFDRRGGNHNVDAAHFIRQTDAQHNVALDVMGPGIFWFARHNRWHGSPWHYRIDGEEFTVRESSTADPLQPDPQSVFMPKELFPKGLTWTWSTTQGADLTWVPLPFERRFQLAYGRARYGTGYFIYWKVMPGLDHLSRPLESWRGTEQDEPPQEVLDLLARSGTDIAPKGKDVTRHDGRFSLAPFETKTVLFDQEGPAMLRRLAFRVPEEDAERFADARLRIYWDDRRQPSVDAPLGLFFGTGSLMRDSSQTYIVESFPMTVKREDGQFLFATYFPMPFHESARIEVAEMTGHSLGEVRWEARHEPYTDPPNHVGWFHATYRDFPHPQPGRDLVLLDTRDVEGGGPWAGHFVGTTYLFTKQGNLRTLEGDPRFYFDDSRAPQGHGTGSEEWGGGGDYWGGRTMTLPFVGHPVGRPPGEAETARDRIHSAYRFLLSDLMPFGRNARITLEHGSHNQSEEHYETVAYWYGRDEPALVLTDEFDVGNAAEEERHAYQATEETPVDTVVSRHQRGVDHVQLPEGEGETQVFPPIADDGRRTTGTATFTLNLQPDNRGVLLRRRLDLAYPNQKARVLVAEPDTAGESQWEEAGIWYTAGGNTTVFADPAALPDSERTAPPELADPAHIVWRAPGRRWDEDEFMIPRRLTEGRDQIRVRLEHLPVGKPLFPGGPAPEEAWTAFRYWAYCFVMPGAYTPARFALQLAVHYDLARLDGGQVPDQSGNGRDGTAHGVSIAQSERGPVGAFDGEAYVEVEADSAQPQLDEAPLTVGGWVRPEEGEGVFVSQGGAADGFSLYLREGRPEFAVRRFDDRFLVRSPQAVPLGEWVHLAAMLTADHRLRLYVNGKQVAEKQISGLLKAVPVDNFLVGADRHSSVGRYSSDPYWRGLIDDVRVYRGILPEETLQQWVRSGD